VNETRRLRITSSAVTKRNPPEVTNWEGKTPDGQTIKVVEDGPPLLVGDRIEYAVTHEINVDGEKAWVKYGVNAAVQGSETTQNVVEFVNQKVIEAATVVANQILKG
jgi:hypothetical protein